MKLHSQQENPAILSNVQGMGEFRIRNSSKAFAILSSGLYANKIRAIIRELSTNAVDSHVAAGCGSQPIVVHLPSALEPWFSVADQGVGLDHNEIRNIWTTYFESTKTDSNDFIGTLGLGSKSPFAYTDNFTITSVKNGIKGIYTAYINQAGIPAIALMSQQPVTDHSGVTVTVPVLDHNDCWQFVNEAAVVYQYFQVQPQIVGQQCPIRQAVYLIRDIVPGVHAMNSNGRSVAVMGNIAYPIQVPNAREKLGTLSSLLDYGLEMHFGIGELDIQASREGLSYIPQTVECIRLRLTQVQAALTRRVADELAAIDCVWTQSDRAWELWHQPLTRQAVVEYVKHNHAQMLVQLERGSHHIPLANKPINLTVGQLAQWNIQLLGFETFSWRTTATAIKPHQRWDASALPSATTVEYWTFSCRHTYNFVINDIGRGALSRAKRHFVENGTHKQDHYLLSPIDPVLPCDFDSFWAALRNPPASWRLLASSLAAPTPPARTKAPRPVLKLERRAPGTRPRDSEWVWRPAGTVDQTDPAVLHYYIPVKGLTAQTRSHVTAGAVMDLINSAQVPSLANTQLWGVRTQDLSKVESLPNWHLWEDWIESQLNQVSDAGVRAMAASRITNGANTRFEEQVANLLPSTSPFVDYVAQQRSATKLEVDLASVTALCKIYCKNTPTEARLDHRIQRQIQEFTQIYQTYPLLTIVDYRYVNNATDLVADYIKLIDQTKGD